MNTKIFIDKYVIARSNQSGVWFGKIKEMKKNKNEGWDIIISDAMKCHGWENTAATSGLAYAGPGEGSRICQPLNTGLVDGAFEILICTKQSIQQFFDIKKWE